MGKGVRWKELDKLWFYWILVVCICGDFDCGGGCGWKCGFGWGWGVVGSEIGGYFFGWFCFVWGVGFIDVVDGGGFGFIGRVFDVVDGGFNYEGCV